MAVLTGYLGNCATVFKQAVREATLDETTRIQLLYINKYKKWYAPQVTMQGAALPADVMRLARNIMRGVLKRHRKPHVKRMNMALDEKVAVVEPAVQCTAFPYWIKLSTLASGKPIYLPVASNPWFDGIPGERKAFVQINRHDNGDYVVGLVKDVHATPYTPQLDMLGLDVGLRVLLTTSEGDLLGQNVMDKLLRWDGAITALARNRQKAGLPVRSPRYDKLVKRVRSFVKNEVHRTLRQALLRHRPARVSVEVLDFRSPKLSRRMNRLVQNFGRTVFEAALAKYAEEYAFTVVEENPAYSSQECHQCHYVDARNRQGDKFHCLHCGYHTHADVNASNNHAQRARATMRSGGKTSRYVKRGELLQKLVQGFGTRKRLAFLRRRLLEDPTLLQKRRHSSPCLCMLSNPYFKDILAPILARVAPVSA